MLHAGTSPVSFIAMFRNPVPDEKTFETALWRHLQLMHEHDKCDFEWDTSVDSDPASNDFSFSIGGRAFFVVGLHQTATRVSRRAPFPCLVFNFHSQFEALKSSGRSIDYASRIYLTTGDVLYTNDSRRMFTIVADTVGRHDFLLTPCSQEMFEILYKHQGHHPSCFENLYTAFAKFDIRPERIGTTFNVFMNVDVSPTGAVRVDTPKSKPGDYIELRADMDMICALTSCSAEKSNNGTFKPIDYEIITRPC